MRFHFSEDQLLLQSTVRDFLAKECTPEHVREAWETESARSPQLWVQLAELGIPGLVVSETHGGMGMDEIDAVLVLEETGRAALAEPVVTTGLVAVRVLEAIGADLAQTWLPRIAAGDAKVAVGHPSLPFVSDVADADLLLLPDAGGALHALSPDAVSREHQPANDPSQRLYRVHFQGTRDTEVAADAEALFALGFDLGAFGSSAQLLGAADRMIALAVEYAAQRQQFGKPIGSFQAVKHQLADAKVELEYARPLVYRAAHSVAHAHPLRSVHVSMAKLAASEAARRCSRAALQVHGAIGYTWEQDLHLFMRRAWSLDLAFGTRGEHRLRIQEAALADGAPLGPGATFA